MCIRLVRRPVVQKKVFQNPEGGWGPGLASGSQLALHNNRQTTSTSGCSVVFGPAWFLHIMRHVIGIVNQWSLSQKTKNKKTRT